MNFFVFHISTKQKFTNHFYKKQKLVNFIFNMKICISKIFKSLLLLLLLVASVAHAQQRNTRILLIPLDDRPPCLQFPIKMGLISDAQLLTPPLSMLGKFNDFGECDAINAWLEQQDLGNIDAAIISMDMLAYGGLVASRVHVTDVATAQKRLAIIRKLRLKKPSLKIYGSSVMMRLAPTADGKNEAYREKLARWADLSPYPENREIVEKLEATIPATALANYKKARHRNLIINELAVQLTKEKIFDYLILSQDDAKPKGIHIAEREHLINLVEQENLKAKITIQPGADEVSMLLLARAITAKLDYHPKIKPIFSAQKMAAMAMPFEDRPLSKTVNFHILAAGGIVVDSEEEADILFGVFTSRFDSTETQTFVNLLAKKCKKPIILADIDPKGNVQGGDTTFTEKVLQKGLFSKFYGYAGWNTAGNTIGTALPHGIVYACSQVALKPKSSKKAIKRREKAQNWFMLNRLLDDYTYHSIVRPKALDLIKRNQWNAFHLTPEQTQVITDFCKREMLPLMEKLSKIYPTTEGGKIKDLKFVLPWNRTFEAAIDFKQ